MNSPTAEDKSPDYVRVYESLCYDISIGTYLPGEKLPVRLLADKYQAGLMPVREAVQRLAAENALEQIANRTISIPVLDETEFLDLTDTLLLLDDVALDKAWKDLRKNSAELEKLSSIVEKAGLSTAPLKESEYLQSVADFWEKIYFYAGSDVLVKYINILLLRAGPMLGIPFNIGGLALDYYLHQRACIFQDLMKYIAENRRSDALLQLKKHYRFLTSWLQLHYFMKCP